MASEIDLRKVLQKIGREGKRRIKPYVPSQTIAESIQFRTDKTNTGWELRFFSPYFWAGILHEGRGPVFADTGRWLVWFKDPSADPRLQPWKTYPKKLADVRHLSEEEFYWGLSINEAMYVENPSGGKQQFMVIAKESPPIAGVPFYSLGLRDVGKDLDIAIPEEIAKAIRADKQLRGERLNLILRI